MADDAPNLTIPTLEEVVATLKAGLPATHPINNTDAFSVWGTFLELAAQTGVDARAFMAALASQGFATLASGDWLDLHARNVRLADGAGGYGRIAARNTVGPVSVIVNGPGTVPRGAIVQTLPGAGGEVLRYLVVNDTALDAPGGTLLVRAESPGASYNVGASRIRTLVTVLPFVTSVDNAGDWLNDADAVAGVDRESDAQLLERLLLRWPDQSEAGIWRNYALWAREVPGIVKVLVQDDHPRGQGTVNVVIAPTSGAPTAQQVADAAAIAEARRPVTADVLVKAPTLVPTDVTLTVVRKANPSDAIDAWVARVQAAIDALSIGETLYPSHLSDVLHDSAETEGVLITAPAVPVDPGGDGLITAGAITVTLA